MDTGIVEDRPKRPRLFLDRRAPSTPNRSSQTLYLPGFAGVNMLRSDMEMDELPNAELWVEEVGPMLEEECNAFEEEPAAADEEDRPPTVTPNEP